jgi:hypothetical protein
MEYQELRSALTRLHSEAEWIERALNRHAAAERDPASHGRLHRLHGVIRDFRLAMPAVAP